MNNEQENTKLVAQGLDGFIKQFGEDIYAQILLEIIIEGLENEETLFIFGQPEQEGSQITDSSSNGQGNHFENRQCDTIEPSSGLGEENSANSL